mgnify:CR=1 FL=1
MVHGACISLWCASESRWRRFVRSEERAARRRGRGLVAVAERLQIQLGIAIALSLLVMVIVGYFHGHRFIQPILALTRGSRQVAEGKLDTRVAVTSHDELGQLGEAFNNMTGRLADLQDEVRAKERQATFGRVAIGLVHDLSHPIQNIGNSCKLIVKMFDDLEYRKSFRTTVERELAQVKRVLDDLRNIAKPLPVTVELEAGFRRTLGAFGDPMGATPRLDRLAAEGHAAQRITGGLWVADPSVWSRCSSHSMRGSCENER